MKPKESAGDGAVGSGTAHVEPDATDDLDAKLDAAEANLRASAAASAAPKVPEPSPQLAALPPKRTLLNRPWTSDWVFWVVAGFAVLGVRSMYRTGQDRLFTDGATVLLAGLIDIVFTMLVPVVIIGLPSVFIRALVRRSRDKKAFTTIPSDSEAGWKPDPLNERRQRWWNGDRWTRATNPQPDMEVGIGSSWVIGGVFVALAAAFLLGQTNDPRPTSQQTLDSILEQGITSPEDAEQLADTYDGLFEGDAPSEPPPNENAQVAVAVYFNDLVTAITNYTQVPVNVENPAIPIIEQREYLNEVAINHEGFSAALGAINTQEQLGGDDAPDLQALREFSDATGPYVQVREDLYAELETCGPLTIEREWGPCEFNVLADAQQSIENTVADVVQAYENVQATISPV